MRFFKRIQLALDAFLAPDDTPVRSSHALDAGRDAQSPYVDAHYELRERTPRNTYLYGYSDVRLGFRV